MLSVQARTSHTSQGFLAISPWNDPRGPYTVGMVNLGNNPISLLVIVSSLNSFNIARAMYGYNYPTYTSKYNPKVYLSAVQGVATDWDKDSQDPTKVDEKWASNGVQKSGSWPYFDLICSFFK